MLGDGFESIEAIAPVDIMRRAGIDVTLISVGDNLQVDSAQDVMIVADALVDEISLDSFDMIVLPGGSVGVENLSRCAALMEALKHYMANNRPVAAICAAPTILADLSLLDGHAATCYPGCEDNFPDGVYVQESVVVSDNLITSAGPGTALLFGKAIVQELVGKDIADQVSKGMLF